jgi:hypothetical protein
MLCVKVLWRSMHVRHNRLHQSTRPACNGGGGSRVVVGDRESFVCPFQRAVCGAQRLGRVWGASVLVPALCTLCCVCMHESSSSAAAVSACWLTSAWCVPGLAALRASWLPSASLPADWL